MLVLVRRYPLIGRFSICDHLCKWSDHCEERSWRSPLHELPLLEHHHKIGCEALRRRVGGEENYRSCEGAAERPPPHELPRQRVERSQRLVEDAECRARVHNASERHAALLAAREDATAVTNLGRIAERQRRQVRAQCARIDRLGVSLRLERAA